MGYERPAEGLKGTGCQHVEPCIVGAATLIQVWKWSTLMTTTVVSDGLCRHIHPRDLHV